MCCWAPCQGLSADATLERSEVFHIHSVFLARSLEARYGVHCRCLVNMFLARPTTLWDAALGHFGFCGFSCHKVLFASHFLSPDGLMTKFARREHSGPHLFGRGLCSVSLACISFHTGRQLALASSGTVLTTRTCSCKVSFREQYRNRQVVVLISRLPRGTSRRNVPT